MIDPAAVSGFDRDEGNARKSETQHGVSQIEAEQVFFNEPLLVVADPQRSDDEERYHAPGITDLGRPLPITFTLLQQDTLSRVISARSMHRRERTICEQARQAKKENPDVQV